MSSGRTSQATVAHIIIASLANTLTPQNPKPVQRWVEPGGCVPNPSLQSRIADISRCKSGHTTATARVR